MTITTLLPPEAMDRFIELALDVGGDLGQSQMLLELICDEYCPTFVVPNLWVYEYEKSEQIE